MVVSFQRPKRCRRQSVRWSNYGCILKRLTICGFINLTRSRYNLTGCHGQAMFVRVFSILLKALRLSGLHCIVYSNVEVITESAFNPGHIPVPIFHPAQCLWCRGGEPKGRQEMSSAVWESLSTESLNTPVCHNYRHDARWLVQLRFVPGRIGYLHFFQ